ncbi:hypothetical protein LXJ15735_05640 [Lacrimispora xylanolytica]
MKKDTYRQIKIDLEMIQEITEFFLSEEINQHGHCMIKGIIADGSQDQLVLETRNDDRIRVFLEDGTTLFTGVAEDISVYLDGDLYKAEINLISASYLMDLEKKSGSYQDKTGTYQEILSQISKEYCGGDIMDSISGGKPIGSLLVQYEETDWEFLKRLASHFHAGILPDSRFGEPKIYFGLKHEAAVEELTSYSYKIEKNIGNYKRLQAVNCNLQTETDAISFQVSSGQFYKTGSCVKFQGKDLFIRKMEAEKVQGEVVFHYWLDTQNGLKRPFLYADKLTGVSLEAKVVKSVKDKVLVKFAIDEKRNGDKPVWEFPYQTMYTAGAEGGWYCMPEPGDQVFIYFPDKKEENAVAENSSRSGKNRDSSTSDPAIKYFRTIHGKEIRFTKRAVIITCSDGTSITLNEGNGISIESEEGITLSSGKGISINANEAIEFYASDHIRLHCKKSHIKMDTKIDIAGPDVRIN